MAGGRRKLIWRVVPLIGLAAALGVSAVAGTKSLSPALAMALPALELVC